MLRPNTTNLSPLQTLNKRGAPAQHYPNSIQGCDELPTDVTSTGDTEEPPTKHYNNKKIKIRPNPVQKTFNIEFPNNYQGIFSIQINDLPGRTYNIGKTLLKGEGSVMKIDISKLSLKSGTYFLKITSADKKTEVFKLVVL